MDAPRDFDIVCVGNATIDVFLGIHDANLHCRINEKECELCVKYGEKIMVDSSEFQVGGGAANVSVGLSRLGLTAGLIAEIGDDELSLKIRNTLAKEGVYRTHVIQTNGAQTSFAIGINFKGERTMFVQHVKREHNFSFDDLQTKWIYIGGLGEEWEGAYNRAVAFAQEKNVRVVFAPGTKQVQAGKETIAHVLAVADVLFLNFEEGQQIIGDETMKDVSALLQSLQSLGPKTVVVTNGQYGSYSLDETKQETRMAAANATPVERTGAGDAYASGFLAATLLGKGVEQAMEWGTKNAGAVIGKVGAQPGLLKREEIEKV